MMRTIQGAQPWSVMSQGTPTPTRHTTDPSDRSIPPCHADSEDSEQRSTANQVFLIIGSYEIGIDDGGYDIHHHEQNEDTEDALRSFALRTDEL